MALLTLCLTLCASCGGQSDQPCDHVRLAAQSLSRTVMCQLFTVQIRQLPKARLPVELQEHKYKK